MPLQHQTLDERRLGPSPKIAKREESMLDVATAGAKRQATPFHPSLELSVLRSSLRLTLPNPVSHPVTSTTRFPKSVEEAILGFGRRYLMMSTIDSIINKTKPVASAVAGMPETSAISAKA